MRERVFAAHYQHRESSSPSDTVGIRYVRSYQEPNAIRDDRISLVSMLPYLVFTVIYECLSLHGNIRQS